MTRRTLATLAGLALLGLAPAAPANAICELSCVIATVDCLKHDPLGTICVPPLLP